MLKRVLSLIFVVIFASGSMLPAGAQGIILPKAGSMVDVSAPFNPFILRGVKLDPQQPFRFNFIIDQGDAPLHGEAFNEETRRLAGYFLTALTIPEKDLWVNLSPYESGRIIEENFGRTAMGRDILAVDYLLKQITSSLMYPDSPLGKTFWAEVYRRTFEKYGTTDIPMDTFNKVWIVPSRAVVYEKADAQHAGVSAYIDNARLKVMLETDYLAASKTTQVLSQTPNESAVLTQQIIREVIIPVLEKEVNEGRNFASLRQVYYSMLLAVWFKKKLVQGQLQGRHILSDIFIDRQKTIGNETDDPKAEIGSIYDTYVEAFKKGAYNLVKEEYDLYSQELIPRKYFSGGLLLDPSQALDIRPGAGYSPAQETDLVTAMVDIKPPAKPGFFDEERSRRSFLGALSLLVGVAVVGCHRKVEQKELPVKKAMPVSKPIANAPVQANKPVFTLDDNFLKEIAQMVNTYEHSTINTSEKNKRQ